MTSLTPVNKAVAACLGLGLIAGCASKPVAVDNSPLVKTATITKSIRNNGFKGFFANDGQQVIRTVANMRRVDDSYKFTGTLMSRFGGKRSTSEIIRLDKNLEWQMDNRRKNYTECALDGCGNLTAFNLDTYAADSEANSEESTAAECVLSVTENDFSINKTGQQREINGFPADEYAMQWVITVTDTEGASSTSQLTSTTWTTPVTGNVAEALQMGEVFDAAYRGSVTQSYPEQFGDVLPEDAVAAIERYLLDSMGEEFLNDLKAMIAGQDQVTGYPVSQKVQWDMAGTTCAEPQEIEEEDDSRLDVSSIRGLLKSVGKQVVTQEIDKRKEAKALEIKMAPVFSIVTEVTSIEIGEIRESKLSVPANYKLRNRS